MRRARDDFLHRTGQRFDDIGWRSGGRDDRPIGMNQSIQHPLAVNWMELEAANLIILEAATLYDQVSPVVPRLAPAATTMP